MRPIYQYIADEASLPQNLTCGVCHDVAITHRGCPQCKATFCKECMDQWFETQKRNMQPCSCPYCRRPLRYSRLRHDTALQAQLDQLQVKCPNTAAGCTAILARLHVKDHLNKECPAQAAACPHCGLVDLRRELVGHEAQCPQRPIACVNAAAGCAALVPASAMQHHLDANCEWQTGRCAACARHVPRREWRRHALHDCAGRSDCPGRPLGCGFGGEAAEVLLHAAPGGCQFAANFDAIAGAAGVARAAAVVPVPDDDCGCLLEAERMLAEGGYVSCFTPTIEAATGSAASEATAGAAAAEARPLEAAAAAAAGGAAAGAPAAGASPSLEPPTAASSSSAAAGLDGLTDWEDSIELGLKGCAGQLGIESLHSDEATDAAWRTVLNLGLVEAMSGGSLPTVIPARSMYMGLLRAWDTVARYMDDLQTAWWAGRDMRAAARAARRAAVGRSRPPVAALRRHLRDDSDAESDASSDYYQDIDDSDDWDPPEAAAGELQPAAVTPAAASGSDHQQQQQQPPAGSSSPSVARRQQQRHVAVHITHHRGHVHTSHAHTHPQQGQQGQPPPALRRRGFPLAVSGPGGAAAQGLDEDEREDLWAELGKLGLHEALAGLGARAASALWARAESGGAGERLGSLVDMSVACVVRDLEVVREQQQQEQRDARRRGRGHRHGSGGGGGSGTGEGPGDAPSSEMVAITRVVEGFRGLPAAPGMHATAWSAALGEGSGGGSGSGAQQAAARALARLRKQVASPGGREMVPLAVVAEFLSARLLLDHFMAERIETTSIPTTNAHITHGWRTYWGPSLLRLAAAHAPRAAVSWRALAAANDMCQRMAQRVLALMAGTMFDAGSNAVEVSGETVLTALRLALPPALFDAVAPRARAAMMRFHDVECGDLSQVTWARLAQQLELRFELGKMVGVVDVAVPMMASGMDEEEDYGEEDEDEDMEDGSDDEEETGSGSYTSASNEEEEDPEEAAEQLQRGGPRGTRSGPRGRGGGGRGRGGRAGRGGRGTGGGGEGDWESASEEEDGEGRGRGRRSMDVDRPVEQQGQGQGGQRQLAGLGDLGGFLRRAVFGSPASGVPPGSGGGEAGGAGQQPADPPAAASGSGRGQGSPGTAAAAVAAVAITDAAVAQAGGSMEAATATAESVAARLAAEGAALLSGPYEEVRERLRAMPASPLLLAVYDFVAAPPGHLHREAALQRIQQAATSPADIAQILALQQLIARGAGGGAGGGPELRQQDGPEGDSSDRGTEGVVVLTAALEAAVEKMLGGALAIARAGEGAHAGAAAAAGKLHALGGGGVAAEVVVTARHVMLAVARDEALSGLFLGSGASLAGAGVPPSIHRSLLPHPAREPIAAALAALASLQPRHAMAAGGGALLFPIDLKHYCGYDGGEGGPALRCCFFSGRQCGRCVQLTAAAGRHALDRRLDDCKASLQHYLPVATAAARSSSSGGSSSGGGPGGALPTLTGEQLDALMEGARLYALQRAWWFDGELRSGRDERAAAALEASLPRVAELMAPLRDVEALRQVQEQQRDCQPAIPGAVFEDMVLDALETALAGPGSGAAVAAAPPTAAAVATNGEVRPYSVSSSGMAVGEAGAPEARPRFEDFEVEPEAMEALASAAEALLAEQFATAQGLALRAGRQEVQPGDLRAALRMSGLAHLIPNSAAAEEEVEGGVMPGLL